MTEPSLATRIRATRPSDGLKQAFREGLIDLAARSGRSGWRLHLRQNRHLPHHWSCALSRLRIDRSVVSRSIRQEWEECTIDLGKSTELSYYLTMLEDILGPMSIDYGAWERES
jgi:hypothetical protein